MKKEKVAAILPSAGIGKRMGGNKSKQFIELAGKPIIIHTLKKFENCSDVDEIVISTKEKWIFDIQEIIDRYNVSKVKKIVIGGKERQDSVYNGIKALDNDTGIVLIHDVVRPFISVEKIYEIIKMCKEYNAVVVAVAVKDTVKQVDKNGFIEATLDRTKLWSAQTPQAMKYEIALKAFESAQKENFYSTDDVALIERIGVKVKIVEGEYTNIKITTPEDLMWAENFVKNYKVNA